MRLMQWQSVPSIVDTLNKTAMDEIRQEIDTIKQRLITLDEQKKQLDELIERGKQLKAVKDTQVCVAVDRSKLMERHYRKLK
jgi:hypothetical protein